MFETLGHLLEARGPGSPRRWSGRTTRTSATRGYTEMGAVRDELNIGQLCRERFGDEAALIGFGTHTGTVAAASDWDGADGGQARAALAPRQLRAALPRCRAVPRFLLDLAPGRQRLRRAAAASRGWSGSSA